MRTPRRSLFLLHAIVLTSFIAMRATPTHAQTAADPQAQTVSQSSNWDDAVHSLAAKIANLVGHARTISFDVKNISSLTTTDAAAIRQALESELARRQFHLAPSAETETQIFVTLSQDVDGYLWVAQLHTDSGDRVEMISVSKRNAISAKPPGPALALEKKMIWQQPAPFLDFAVLTALPGSISTLMILEPDRLAFYTSSDSMTWQPSQSIPIPHSTPWPRDLRGSINQGAGKIVVANVRCAVNFPEPDKMQCAPQPQSEQPKSTVKVPGHEESETALLSDHCSEQSIVLSTGNGDWMQPDLIQGYLFVNLPQNAHPSGDPLPADGPVISLLPGPLQTAARAVVHDLKTGNYEAYVITANCAH